MFHKLIWTVAGLIAIWFVSACASAARGPIRPAEDPYIDVARAIEAGQPFDAYAQERPITYPLVLVGLDRLGLTGNAGLIGFNVMCLAAGLAAFAAIARRALDLATWEIAAIVSGALCSHVVFDLATMAQPEMAYLATTMGALLCVLRAASSRRRAAWVAGAIALTAASIALRTIGIALLPAVLWTLRSKARNPIWVAAAVAAGILGGACLWNTQYARILPFHSHAFSQAHPALFVAGTIVPWRLQSIVELFTNLDAASIGRYPWVVRQEVSLVGLLLFLPILCEAWKYRRSALAAYFAAYCAIIFVWPFSYTRFFMPVVPCLFAFEWLAVRDVYRAVRGRKSAEETSSADRAPTSQDPIGSPQSPSPVSRSKASCIQLRIAVSCLRT